MYCHLLTGGDSKRDKDWMWQLSEYKRGAEEERGDKWRVIWRRKRRRRRWGRRRKKKRRKRSKTDE